MAVEKIRRDVCTGCGRCLDVCPMDVFQRAADQIYIAYPADCMACYLCEIECPTGAVHVTGKRARQIPYPY